MSRFRPSPFIEPRAPVFREPVPIWAIMLLVFAIGVVIGVGSIMVTASMFP